MLNFQLTCKCNCPGIMMDVKNASLTAWQIAVARNQILDITCNFCKCEHSLVDTGTDIEYEMTPKPRIDSIDTTSGPANGGTVVILTGHALDQGTLVVKFGNLTSENVRNITSSSATVDTPPGRFKLLTQGPVTGNMSPEDIITGSVSGKTAKILEIALDFILVTAPSGVFVDGELAKKDDNNYVQISALINSPVDIIVENERGRKITGGTLYEAFTYLVP